MSKGQFILQATYIFLFIFSLFGIVGNIELGQAVPTFWKIVCAITTFLTIGKIVYLELGGK